MHIGRNATILGLIVIALGILWYGEATVWAADPLVSFSLTQIEFPPALQGTSSVPQDDVVTNVGAGALTISDISISGENARDFTETANCPISPATLLANGHCVIRVVFKPSSATGDETATLEVADNASGSPQAVSLKGTAKAAAPAVQISPDGLNFGRQLVNSASEVQEVKFTNTGSAPLHITTAIEVTGPAVSEFRIQQIQGGCPQGAGEISPRTACLIGVVFSPATTGVKTAQITITDDAAGSPQTVPLSGTGVAASPATQ